jgi:hypothetical protein
MTTVNRWVLGALLFTALGSSSLIYAASVPGQGTWESTLQGRDLDGNAASFEAYYDTVLNITWLTNANGAGTVNWADANAWAAGLNIDGVTGWRLPETIDIGNDGCNFANAGTDCGYNVLTSTGEMASMFYDTLGNLAQFDSTGSPQSGSGTSNTGPFSNIQTSSVENRYYWSATALAGNSSTHAWIFDFGVSTTQSASLQSNSNNPGLSSFHAWAVRDGDVAAAVVPVPAAVWMFGSALGLLGWIRRKSA